MFDQFYPSDLHLVFVMYFFIACRAALYYSKHARGVSGDVIEVYLLTGMLNKNQRAALHPLLQCTVCYIIGLGRSFARATQSLWET